MLFSEKRLAFDTPENVKANFVTNTESTEAGIESSIKLNKKSAKEATDQAILIVRDSAGKTADRIAKIATLSQADKMKWIKEIEGLRTAALGRIEKNRERYENIARFTARQTEIKSLLASNNEALMKTKGKHDLKHLTVLGNVADALKADNKGIAAMNADGVEKEKSELIENMTKQITALEAEKKATVDFHKEQLKKAYDELVEAYMDLSKAQKEDKEYSIPSGLPRAFSDAGARKAWLNLAYLKGLEMDLAAVEGQPDLQSAYNQAKTAANNCEPLLLWWDEKLLQDRNNDANKKKRKAWTELATLRTNIEKARAQVERMSRPGVPQARKAEAEAWLNGALESYNRNLTLVENTVRRTQDEKGETDYTEPSATRYASRTGTYDEAATLAMIERGTAEPAKPGERPAKPGEEQLPPDLVARVSPGEVVMGEQKITVRAPEKKDVRVASRTGRAAKKQGPGETTA